MSPRFGTVQGQRYEPFAHHFLLSQFLQQLLNGLFLGSIYALIALGYTMVYGVLRFINFAHGDVFMLGAFTGLYLNKLLAPMMAMVPWPVGMLVILVTTPSNTARTFELG